MNRRTFHSATVALLLIVFATFNVGIPVVKYLCPLMSDAQPHCSMCIHAPEGTSAILPPVPSCCASYIIAERNTTPFLSAKSLNIADIAHTFVALECVTVPVDAHVESTSQSQLAPPLPPDDALFLRHGCLLI